MKTKWPTKKLGEVCEINMGQSPASSTYNTNQDGLPFYQGKKDFGEKYPTPRIWCSNPIKIVEVGDILISVRAPVGALNVAKEKSCIGRGLAGLRAKKELNQDFLFCYLQLVEEDISALGIGSTFTAISRKHLENLEIPLPPLSEQKRIVEKIEKLFAKIDEAERLRAESLATSATLLPSALHQVFSRAKKENWPTKKLREIAILNPKKQEVNSLSDNLLVSFVPMSAVDEITQTIKEYEFRRLSSVKKGYTYFKEGDILFAKITPCMENGKVAIAKNLKNGIGFGSTEFHVLRPRDKVLAEWIFYIVGSHAFREEAERHMTGTAGQQRVPIGFLGNAKIPLPPISEQKKIVAYLDALSQKYQELQKLQEETAADIFTLKQSVLTQAFNQN